jgi:hypothetical protein
MPRRPVGDRALTATERSKYRRDRAAEYVAALERLALDAEDYLPPRALEHYAPTIDRARAAQKES